MFPPDVLPTYFQGVRIYFSEHAQERTTLPVRAHQQKRHSLAYHQRVQKKWIKRFGYVHKPCMYKVPQGIVAHPSLKAQLEAALISQGHGTPKGV